MYGKNQRKCSTPWCWTRPPWKASDKRLVLHSYQPFRLFFFSSFLLSFSSFYLFVIHVKVSLYMPQDPWHETHLVSPFSCSDFGKVRPARRHHWENLQKMQTRVSDIVTKHTEADKVASAILAQGGSQWMMAAIYALMTEQIFEIKKGWDVLKYSRCDFRFSFGLLLSAFWNLSWQTGRTRTL